MKYELNPIKNHIYLRIFRHFSSGKRNKQSLFFTGNGCNFRSILKTTNKKGNPMQTTETEIIKISDIHVPHDLNNTIGKVSLYPATPITQAKIDRVKRMRHTGDVLHNIVDKLISEKESEPFEIILRSGYRLNLTDGVDMTTNTWVQLNCVQQMEYARQYQIFYSKVSGMPIKKTSKGIEFILIPPGAFWMGSPEDEPNRYSDEKRHRVSLLPTGKNKDAGAPFYFAKTPITQKQWEKHTGENPSYFKGVNRPVESVNWNQCVDFLKKVNKKMGLPTEAQWEYACRAGTTTAYSFGNDPEKLSEYAWYNLSSEQGTQPVAQKKPNAWGLYDMHGNVWEWCKDGYTSYE